MDPTDPDLAVRARGLVKRCKEVTALAGVDLDVPRGSVLGLLGPNGAGKTTIVRIRSDPADRTSTASAARSR